jgi:hypothetical protein
MARGKYPKVDKARKAHPPSSLPNFLTPATWDSSLGKMGRGGNPIKETSKHQVPPEVVKKLEEDQRVAMASLSSGLWALNSAEKLLAEICPSAPTNSGLQDAHDLVSAANKWLLTTSDRLVVGLSSLILMRRDLALGVMDPLVPQPTLEELRAAPFTAPSLFEGKTDQALTDLILAREANKPTLAIKEMVSLTRAISKKPSQPKAGNKRSFSTAQGKPTTSVVHPKPSWQAPVASTSTAPSGGFQPPKRKHFRGPRKNKGKKV